MGRDCEDYEPYACLNAADRFRAFRAGLYLGRDTRLPLQQIVLAHDIARRNLVEQEWDIPESLSSVKKEGPNLLRNYKEWRNSPPTSDEEAEDDVDTARLKQQITEEEAEIRRANALEKEWPALPKRSAPTRSSSYTTSESSYGRPGSPADSLESGGGLQPL